MDEIRSAICRKSYYVAPDIKKGTGPILDKAYSLLVRGIKRKQQDMHRQSYSKRKQRTSCSLESISKRHCYAHTSLYG